MTLPYIPREHQREAHERRLKHRWSVLVWHRRAGKTVFAIMELVLAALAFSQIDGRFGYICPLLKQSREVAWTYLKRFTRAIPGVRINESDLSIGFPNGAVIRLYGADNPDSIRGGYFDGVVVDEVGQTKRFLWGEVLRPMLSDRKGWALFIGTPKGVNLFSEIFYGAQGNEDWYSDLRTCYDTDALEKPEIEDAKKTMSGPQFAQEMLCDFFAAVENCLIPLEAIEAAMNRDLRPEAYNWAPKIIGVDVARFGDDKSTIAKRQGSVAFRLESHQGVNTMQLAGRVAAVAEEWDADAIFVDVTGGLGAGPADRLRELGYPAIDVEFGGKSGSHTYRNKRSEMWGLMAEWCKTACLPDDPELKQELSAGTYEFNSSGQKFMHDKDEIKERIGRSPDRADAVACTFHSPVAVRDADRPIGRRGRAAAGHQRVATDYDPYSPTNKVETNYDPYRS
jgi:hypothetical protein